MKDLLSLLGNKYFLWIVILTGIFGVFYLRSCMKSDYETSLDAYRRQLSGQLTDKERELQAANNELGIARSELVSQEELNKRLEKEKNELDARFKEFVKQHDLEIASKDETIARLRQQIEGGNSGTDIIGCDDLKEKIKSCIIVYNWEDGLGRFKLRDPNIFELNNEIFTSEQYFKIYGEIWKQKDGSLQTRRVVLREVRRLGENQYEDIPNAKAEIVAAEFVYQNEPWDNPNFTWKDLFRLRAIAVANIHIAPHPGQTNFAGGVQFFNYKGWGANTHLSLNLKEPLMSEPRVGLAYSPKIFDTELNLAVGASLGTPFKKLFDEYSLTFDIIFFINN